MTDDEGLSLEERCLALRFVAKSDLEICFKVTIHGISFLWSRSAEQQEDHSDLDDGESRTVKHLRGLQGVLQPKKPEPERRPGYIG